tara:strand:+ start:812 stop:2077 length:1266 start_codon:yes stop_codon:yes gene_type:complete
MAILAINGGEKYRKQPFPHHPIIGDEEKKAVRDVLDSGNVSTFVASPGEYFLGGKKIKEFEKIFSNYFGIKYAVAVNSGTAALHAAVAAIGVKPGDEVIVTPYSFTASATSVLMNNAVPIFVDIDENNFCINPKKIEEKITDKTKAIIIVHLFGGSADMDEIMEIARKHDLKVIEDCAQSPGAIYKNKLLGTIGDCAIFSFTESKHITSGEGGMLITNSGEIVDISRLIRNHGEAVIEGMPRQYKSFILGFGYRMTELDAALGIEQFKRLDYFNFERIKLIEYLAKKIDEEIDGIKPCLNNKNGKNVYFCLAFKYDESKVGIPRDLFIRALNSEGIPFGAGYVKPLYLSPIYHENKHLALELYAKNISYDKGICPIVEKLHEKELIITMMCRPPATFKDMDDIVGAMKKVIKNKEELKDIN